MKEVSHVTKMTHHSVLNLQSAEKDIDIFKMRGISLKEGSGKTAVLGRLVVNHWLQLLVVSNQHSVLTQTNGDNDLGLICHHTLIYDALTRSEALMSLYSST